MKVSEIQTLGFTDQKKREISLQVVISSTILPKVYFKIYKQILLLSKGYFG